VLVRYLGQEASSWAILHHYSFLLILFSGPIIFSWGVTTITFFQFYHLIIIGLLSFLAQLFLNRGFMLERAATASLLKNWYVLTNFIIDYFVVGTEIGWVSYMGAALIMGSSFVVVYSKVLQGAEH